MDGSQIIEMNAPKGLGDAIYLRAVVLHLQQAGRALRVFTAWPEVFDGLRVETLSPSEVTPQHDMRHVTACLHCRVPEIMVLTQFRNACLQAGMIEPIALQLGWRVRNRALVERVKKAAGERQIMLYQPVKRANSDDQALLRPRRQAFNRFVRERHGWFRIKIGHPNFVDPDPDADCELDLLGKISVHDVFDIATASDAMFSEPCFLTILGQALDKPVTCMFARAGLASTRKRVSGVRPERLFHKAHLGTAIYDD